MTQFDSRNISMMMDFYEMTMANGYFETGGTNTKVAFDVFYRRNPDSGGFAIFAGLEQIIDYVENMNFSAEDVEYFRSQNLFSEDFLNYLANFHFHGDIYAFPEGTINRTTDVIMPFKFGSVKACSKTQAPLVPFIITGNYRLFRKGIKIEFLPALTIGPDLEKENNNFMEIVREKLIAGGKKYERKDDTL